MTSVISKNSFFVLLALFFSLFFFRFATSIILNQKAVLLNELLSEGSADQVSQLMDEDVTVNDIPSFIFDWYYVLLDYEDISISAERSDVYTLVEKFIKRRQFGFARAWWLANNVNNDEEQQFFWGGKICQLDYDPQFCKSHVWDSKSNLFINSSLGLGSNGWNISARQFSTSPCPKSNEQQCAFINVQIGSERSASWTQCLYLPTSVKTIHLSAWILVDAPIDTTWRPVYAFGEVAEESRGIWPATYTGSANWEKYETIVDVSSFNKEKLACFYPIVLQGAGQAWFHTPTLTLDGEIPFLSR